MNLTEQQRQLAAHLWAVVAFIEARRGRLMPWATDRDLLFRYVASSHYHGKLNLVWKDNQIEAVAFCWPDFQERIEAKFAEGLPQFSWDGSQHGDALFIADVLGSRQAVARLYQRLIERWPHLMAVPFLTYRKDKLVKLDKSRLERFVTKGRV